MTEGMSGHFAETARRRLLTFATLSWVPLAGATLSLVLSVISIIVSTREPQIVLIAPEHVRVAQGEDFGYAYMYLQPALVSTGQNDRVEVVRDLSVRVEPMDGGEGATFEWDEVVRLVPAEGDALDYEYVADAVPLLVSPRTAQAPLASFTGPDGWYFEAGTYRLTIHAVRVVGSGDLSQTVQMTLTDEQVTDLNESRGRQFIQLPLSPG